MRGANASKLAASQQFVVLIAPGSARIMRAVPLARGRDDGSGRKHPLDRGPERLQAPLRASLWAEALEGLQPGLHYLH